MLRGCSPAGHDIAVVEQGHRYLPALRPRRGGPGRAGCAVVHPRSGYRCGAGRRCQARRVAARPHDRGGRGRPGRAGCRPLRPDDDGWDCASSAREHRAAWRPGRRVGCGQRAHGSRAIRRRDRLFGAGVCRVRPRSDGCRTDDVRPGQLGALPAQDLQRVLASRRRAAAEVPVRDDPQHLPAHQRRRDPVGVLGQRRRDRGCRHGALLPGRRPRLPFGTGANACADEGRDPQPSHRHRPLSRRRDRVRGRDPRRGRRRTRLQAQGGHGRVHHQPPGTRAPARTLGTRRRQAGADRVGAGDHAGRAFGRRRLQQRIRPALSRRLLPNLRGAGRGRGRMGLSQARDDRRRRRRGGRSARERRRGAGRREAGGARRSRDADRPRRRCRVQHGLRGERLGTRLRLGAAGQRRDAAPLPGGHRPLLRPGRRQSDPADPRRRRRRALERVAGTRQRRRGRRTIRHPRGPERRPWHVAHGDLVQRSPGTLRPGRAGRGSRCLRCHRDPGALPLRGRRRGHRRPAVDS